MAGKKDGAPARTGAANTEGASPKGEQTIFRVAAYRERPYSQLGNAMIRDKDLEADEVGVLVFILTYPPDWRFSLSWLCRERGVGRDKARRIIRGIEQAGYCTRHRTRNPDGTLGPYEYVFMDEKHGGVSKDPQSEPEGSSGDGHVERGDPPQTEKPSVAATSVNTTDALPGAGSPVTGQPALANPPPTNIVSPTKTKTKTESTGFEQVVGRTDGGSATLAVPTATLIAATARSLGIGIGDRPRGPMPLDQEGAPFRISAEDRATIEGLGGDVEELFDRAMAQKAKGRRIGNLVRYMVQSAKNDAKTRLGVEMGVVTAMASGNDWARAIAYSAALAGKPEPPEWRKRVATNPDRSALMRTLRRQP